MSDHKPEKKIIPPQAFGWMAEYDDENVMLEAARKVRDAGYTRTDVFAPFPVHGIDEALGIKPTRLPWFTLAAGLTGTTIAFTMQIWMNAVDYPYIISGKPYVSLPAFTPVAFELTVLFAAFTTVFAMLGLNGLPKFSNPVFTSPRFDRATDDRFFLWVDSRDKYFNGEKVQALLAATNPVGMEEVIEDDTPAEIPKGLYAVIGSLILLTIVPLAIVWNIREVRSGSPRWHVFFDMDFQPYRKAQKETTIFADGRTQRPPVPGTVPRGGFAVDDPYHLGYSPSDELAQKDGSAEPMVKWVSTQEDQAQDAPPTDGAADAAAADAEPQLDWLQKLPENLVVDDRFLQLGQNKFNQVCSACHGHAGYGDGLVSQRAEALAATYWLQPTSVHDPRIQQQPIGQIYYTITNGKGKMGGYGSTLNVKERWAVALYVKGLQRSQNAKSSDFPLGKLTE
jgi:mono/diheme cytochrome c family protein